MGEANLGANGSFEQLRGRFRCFLPPRAKKSRCKKEKREDGSVEVWLNLGMDDLHSNILPLADYKRVRQGA